MRVAGSVMLGILLSACTTSAVTGSPSVSTQADTGSPIQQEEKTPSTRLESSMSCWARARGGAPGPISFVDVTGETGLVDPLTGMYGHAAIWTDVNGDDQPDLYFGTFADREDDSYRLRGASGPSPDRLLILDHGAFAVDRSLPEVYSRSSGGAGADLDNDGDFDLVVSRNMTDRQTGLTPTQILENDGGTLTVADAGVPPRLGGRSVAVLDYDLDGLLDVFVTEDRFAGGSSVLLHNEGGLRFSDATASAGIPEDVHGLGVVAADFDGDGRSDIFVSGSNRLFLSDGGGRFVEGDSSLFHWETYGDEDDVAGASVADVNRDGLLDLAVGQHFNSTIEQGEKVSVRLYLNKGGGRFKDVTEAAGLTPLPSKAPHVELNDFNNDGWPDLLTSASAGDGPALFVHEGLSDGIPRFATPAGLGDAQYWVAAPSVDFDRDGRLDVFLLEWEPALPSLLLRNESDSGNWLEVSVGPDAGRGIGWRVEVREGDDLVGAREITVTQGYVAGVLPVAHFGLGDATSVEVKLVPPGTSDPILIEDVAANQQIRWPNGC